MDSWIIIRGFTNGVCFWSNAFDWVPVRAYARVYYDFDVAQFHASFIGGTVVAANTY